MNTNKKHNMQKDYKKKHFNKDFKKDFKKRPFRKKYNRADFYVPGCPDGVKVPDAEFGTLERALKYLKRQLKDSEKLFLAKQRRYYEKPSKKRYIERARAVSMQQRYEKFKHWEDKRNPCWTIMTKNGAI